MSISNVSLEKVNLTVESGQELGISIRGGAEHGLAIYISGVDSDSVAEVNGIKVIILYAIMSLCYDSLGSRSWK